MNYYSILGVNASSSIEEIKEAYKQLSKKYHPNSNSKESSSEKFIQIKKSYDYLLKNYATKEKDTKPNLPEKEPFNGERYYRIINPKLNIKNKSYECTITIPENVLYLDTKIHCMWTNEFTISLPKGKRLPITIEIPMINNKLYMNIITGF